MTRKLFRKQLSANDVGSTGGHQGGVLIPKGERDLLAMLPALDPSIKNPDAWIQCIDNTGETLRFRFVYYNNKLHDLSGTRNEYRITWMTSWFRSQHACEGDFFEISNVQHSGDYQIRVVPSAGQDLEEVHPGPVRVKLRGWQRVH